MNVFQVNLTDIEPTEGVAVGRAFALSVEDEQEKPVTLYMAGIQGEGEEFIY